MLTGRYKFRTTVFGRLVLQVEIKEFGEQSTWEDADLDHVIELMNLGILAPLRRAHLI